MSKKTKNDKVKTSLYIDPETLRGLDMIRSIDKLKKTRNELILEAIEGKYGARLIELKMKGLI